MSTNEAPSQLEQLAEATDAAAANEQQIDIPATETPPTPDQQAVAAAGGEAMIIINLMADGVESVYDCLQYPPEIREQGAARLAPLLEKYNIGGGLLEKWGVEIMAGMFFSGVIVNSVKAVKESRRQKAETPSAAEATPGPEVTPAGMLTPG